MKKTLVVIAGMLVASSSLLLAMGSDNNSRNRSGTDSDLGTRSSERGSIYDSSRSSTGGVMRSGGVTNKWGTSDSDIGVRSSSGSGVGSDSGTMGTRTGTGTGNGAGTGTGTGTTY